MEKVNNYRIPLEKLKRVCNCEEELSFCQTSLDVPPLNGVIGQDRAVKSMQFGLSMDAMGYNIFVAGPAGTGKSTYVEAVVSQLAAKNAAPMDWCYIHNFNDEDRPMAVSLPVGQGRVFQRDMEGFISDLRRVIPKAFESSNYEQQKDSIIQIVQNKMGESFHLIKQEALEVGFNLKQTPSRFIFLPLRDGNPISSEDYENLPIEMRKEIDEKGRKLEKRLEETLHEGEILENEATEQILELEKQIITSAVGPLVNALKEKYGSIPKIVQYLDTVLKDIVENDEILKRDASSPNQIPVLASQEEAGSYMHYRVNLFVNNEKSEGAPVVIEPSPNYYNLFGKIEYESHMLDMSTNFNMVKPGAIHRANGGYLILQAKDVLMDPFAWDTLKKALKYRQAIVENIGEQYRLIPTATLRPEPIPLDLKIILIGSPIYYHIYSMDEDFHRLFKVKVDFDTEMPRTPENLRQYASFVSSLCRQRNSVYFNRAGLAKIIEYGSRLVGDQNKLSTQFNEVTEIVYEAIALAKAEGLHEVDGGHVDKAIKERKYRSNKLEERVQEMIQQDKVLISTEGSMVGQINALSVIEWGGYSFGMPSRITARTYIGHSGVINIERETDMSGNIHSKGVFTLAGYLGGKFAQDKQLGLTAQITFEQNYKGVDGDSASSAELYAILSSLAAVPLRQNLAVTGSVDQHGKIQPIGDATEKIEGFFDTCVAKGLTGEQGVVIPTRNIDNLMVKDEVLQAVQNNLFNIYAVDEIEEGIELLSGLKAGEMDKDGKYPEGSVFYLANKKLREYNEALEGNHEKKTPGTRSRKKNIKQQGK